MNEWLEMTLDYTIVDSSFVLVSECFYGGS
jgi:hypothetical protein